MKRKADQWFLSPRRRLHCLALAITLLLALGGCSQPGGIGNNPHAKSNSASQSTVSVGEKPDFVTAGTPQEIGKAIGEKYKSEIQKLVKDYVQPAVSERINLDQGRFMAAAYEVGIPLRYREEMKAVAAAAEVEYADLLLGNVIIEMLQLNACSVAVLKDEKSEGGRMMFARNLDFAPRGFLHMHTKVIEYRPEGQQPFVAVTFPGLIGVLTGINSKGVIVADLMEPSDKRSGASQKGFGGQPYVFLLRSVLETQSSVKDAVEYVKGQRRTTSNSIAVADASGHGAIIESGVERFEVREIDEGAVCATNTFQKGVTNPPYCWRYERLHQEIEAKGKEPFTPAEAMELLTTVTQEKGTLQSMVFVPESKTLLLKAWALPSTSAKAKVYALNVLE